MSTETKVFEAGEVVLQSGLTLPSARIVYTTYGSLDAGKTNVILYPTSYGAQHTDIEWLVAPGRIHYFKNMLMIVLKKVKVF